MGSNKFKNMIQEVASKYYGKHSNINIEDIDSISNYLNKMESFLNNYEYESSSDFIFCGRKKFIYDEIMKIMNGTKSVDNPIYFVLGSLEEFLSNNNDVHISDSDEIEMNWNELRDANDRYISTGVICLEEINYIRRIISLLKNGLEDSNYNFYKKNENDNIWWVEQTDTIGEHLFSFDKKKVYNLFKDYPYELSNEEKEIFDKENPYWADFFKDRIKEEIGS